MNPINVLIVDDYPFFRQGLCDIMISENDLIIVGEAKDGQQALKMIEQTQPDVVLMDINIPTINGIEVTRRIKSDWPHIGVIILTAYDDQEQIYRAIRAGALAYFAKDIAPDRLLNVIRLVSQGRYVIDSQVMDAQQAQTWLKQAYKRFGVAEDKKRLCPLSPRKTEVLEAIVQGLSNKDIADALGISHQTVKNHITAILAELQVSDRTQVAILAVRRGWVRLQEKE